MPDFKPFNPSDSAEAVKLWNTCLGERFPMDILLWTQNVVNSDFLWPEASHTSRNSDGELIGVLIAKKPSNICCVFVHPDYRHQGIAKKLYGLADEFKADPALFWTVGQDRNHFFPGVPTESQDAIAFFENGLGFTQAPGLITDLSRHLSDFAIEKKVQDKIAELEQSGINIQPCDDVHIPYLLAHIEKNFSARWLSDTQARLKIEGQASEIMIAKGVGEHDVIGFAHTYTNRSKYIGPSIYWRGLLGADYGGLGPIGVDIDHRKIGLGLALLAASIQSVKDRGATQMAIDWTVLVDFYAKVGFSPWKTYVGMRQN